MRKTLALASVAGSLFTVVAAQAQVTSGPTLPIPAGVSDPSVKPVQIQPDDKDQSPDLRDIAGRSGKVFDGVLISKTATLPAGMRVLVTEYTFQVNEWFRGALASRLVMVRDLGGEEADGSAVSTFRSQKLAVNGRYLVFLTPNDEQMLLAFDRVFQILDSGSKVADETGRVVIGLNGEVPLLRQTPELPSTNYLGTAPEPEPVAEVVNLVGSGPVDHPGRQPQPAARNPIPAEMMFRLLRAEGAQAPAGPGPAGLNSAVVGGADWNYCGYINAAHNFATWLPDNNNFTWWDNGMFYWDQEVNYTGSGGWIFGYRSDGSHPQRTTAPLGNDGWDNGGVISDAQLRSGGYVAAGQGWANLGTGNPNGICFNWSTGGGCTRIRESDVFIHPVNGANELQFRKSIVHEFGHSLGLGHEDRFVADMVSGSWRVPPNYALADYLRMDDRQGAHDMMQWSNANAGTSWSFTNWRDIATYSQSHPNVGTSGDVGPNVVQLSTYNASTGQNVTISHMHTENRGRLGFAGAIGLNVYFSTDTNITAADYNVWSGSYPSYPAGTSDYNFSLNFAIPPTIPTGTYYVGWIVSTGEGELTSANNTAIMVRDSSGGFAARTIGITGVTPFNDGCGNAIPVGTGTYTGLTATATTDGVASCAPSGKDVWYQFTSPCNGTLTIDTCGTAFDTVLSIHSSCPGTAANSLACNDDFCGTGNLNSQTSLSVTGGSTYLIRLAGYDYGGGDVRNGAYSLHVNFAAATPPNDSCGSAILVGNGTTNGSTICANSDGSAACGSSVGSPDVWYRYVAPTTGTLHVDTCGSGYDTVISVHTGCPGTSANQLGCNDDYCDLQSSLDVPVSAGGTYYIRVSGWNGSYGLFTLHTGFTPINDACYNAIPIGNGNTPFSTIGATTDGPNETLCPFCCGDLQINQDIWYTYTATCGSATLSMCNANYDTKVAIYDGTTCPSSPGTAIACNDDACGAFGLQSTVSWPTVPGRTYLVRVGGYLSNSGSGTITITPGAAFNDSCSAAISVTPGAYYGGTQCATNDGSANCGSSLTSPDVWYSFTAPSGGTLTVDSCGSTYDTVLSIHTGCPGTSANQLVCNDDDCFCGGSPCRQSLVSTAVTAGNTYLIRVSGFSNVTGTYTIHVGFTPAACYPNCDLSTTPPCLNVLDFSCFLNKFAAFDSYANCDNSTTPPVLNVLDFSCFLNQFAAGCSGC